MAGAGACVRAQPGGEAGSPFLPPAGLSAGGAKPASNPYELTGSSTTSRETKVCIFDAKAKSSHWIAIGGEFGDIRVVSYDPASDLAVIDVHGSRMSLGMRKAVVSEQPLLASAPIPVPASPQVLSKPAVQPAQGVQPVQPQSAETAKQEREARMLVSDLLDIGMQQRKAAEEAKKREQEAQQAAKPN